MHTIETWKGDTTRASAKCILSGETWRAMALVSARHVLTCCPILATLAGYCREPGALVDVLLAGGPGPGVGALAEEAAERVDTTPTIPDTIFFQYLLQNFNIA